MKNKVKDFILENWDRVIRTNREDNGNFIGLPKSYTVPCVDGSFQEMYYWDTYFTNIGLILSGRVEQAKNNVDNMAYLIEKYGFMPNGNRTYFLSRSQPPFFSFAVMDVYKSTGDRVWLAGKLNALKSERDFWHAKRKTSVGIHIRLCRFSGSFKTKNEYLKFGEYMCGRYNIPIPEDEQLLYEYGENMLSLCESGWDCTSRFGTRAQDYATIELNSLLYGLDMNIAEVYKILELGGAEKYISDAELIGQEINDNLWDHKKLSYYDFNCATGKINGITSTAAFYPLFVGLASKGQAMGVVYTLEKLEQEYGAACTEQLDNGYRLQWDYPNGWACQQYIVIKGLLNYGYRFDALRIAGKYVDLVDKNFKKTGNLWEKYNVCTGEVAASHEYECPPMMGWSAGVYLYCKDLLEK